MADIRTDERDERGFELTKDEEMGNSQLHGFIFLQIFYVVILFWSAKSLA